MKISDIREKSKKSNPSNEIYTELIIRRISPYFSWLFLNLKISANKITLIGEVISLIGVVFLGYGKFLIGALLLQLGYILDCSDGEVSRYSKTSSKQGEFLDLIGHLIIIPCMWFAVGIGLYELFPAKLLIIFGLTSGLFSLKLEKMIFPSKKGMDIGRTSLLQSQFRYPGNMNWITILSLTPFLLMLYLITNTLALIYGRLRGIYREFKSL